MAMYKNAGRKTGSQQSSAKRGFKPCANCPSPRACTAMGRCKLKGR